MENESVSSHSAYNNLKQVCVLGNGAWGSIIARIVARNVLCFKKFHPRVYLYCHEELVDGKKLTEIINTTHENIRYAKGYYFTENLVATPDPVEAVQQADIILFVVPHQYILDLLKKLRRKIKSGAIGVSLIKGFLRTGELGINLISREISSSLNMPCFVLMGGNISTEVGNEIHVTRSTLACSYKKYQTLLRELLETEHFRIEVVNDENSADCCGALKNIVSIACGFVDGLGEDMVTKEAVIRLGLIEMVQFVDMFFSTPRTSITTFLGGCGIEDVVVSSFGGRNRYVAAEFMKETKTFKELERELLNGQKLQGPGTADAVNYLLRRFDCTNKFPLFTIVDEICKQQKSPSQFMEVLERNKNRNTYVPKNRFNIERNIQK